jgi:pimeloyl-ACP methyl ester carboxylesterase
MQRDYVNIGTADQPLMMHYRLVGSGTPLLMLHASPMSSQAMVPLMNELSDQVSVIAPDTPGYGISDPLSSSGEGLAPYVRALNSFTDRLQLYRFGLYGTATGAQIAIEFAKAQPLKVDYLILDNAADFTEEEREAFVAGYFPDLTPDDLGTHLARSWSVARDQMLFFPWHLRSPERRLPTGGIDPSAVHAMVLEFLQAGPRYDQAYRAAFANEKLERLRAVSRPTTIMRWQGSILKPYTDRFDQHDWPEHFRMQHCGPQWVDRVDGIRAALQDHLKSDATAGKSVIPTSTSVGPRQFIHTESGELHVRFGGRDDGPPVLLLHDIGQSSEAVMQIAGGSNRVIAVDLPGHGHSATSAQSPDYLSDTALALAGLLHALELDQCTLMACGLSAGLLHALARQIDIDRVILVNPVDGAAYFRSLDKQKNLLDVSPRADGGHLFTVWHWLRDRQLFFPWYGRSARDALHGVPDLDPLTLTQRLLDRFRCSEFAEIERVIGKISLGHQLAEMTVPVDIVRLADTPAADLSRRTFSTPAAESV